MSFVHPNPSLPSAHKGSHLLLVIFCSLLLAMALAGCGDRASGAEQEGAKAARAATEPEPGAQPAEPAVAPEVVAATAEPVAVASAEAAAQPAALPVGNFASKAILSPERLELPSISLDTDVVELGWQSKTLDTGEIYSEWEDADNAAGWHKNSLRPGFGGNVVLSGHNNIMGAVFRELDLLKRGDPAFLYVDNLKFEYVVDKVLIVPEKFATKEQKQTNFSYIEPTGDERLTLVSCWPRDDNTHRIIVIARPVQSSLVN